jgi:hypothetical protein
MVTFEEVEAAKPHYFMHAINKATSKIGALGSGLLTFGLGTELIVIVDNAGFTNTAMAISTSTFIGGLLCNAVAKADEKHAQDNYMALRNAYHFEQAMTKQLETQKVDILKQLGCQETIDNKAKE